jgi:hypothetical protein
MKQTETPPLEMNIGTTAKSAVSAAYSALRNKPEKKQASVRIYTD